MKQPDFMAHPATPYVAPFAMYMAFLVVEQNLPGSVFWLYPLKTLAVAATLAWAWRGVRVDLQHAKSLWFGTAIGFAAFAVWIAPELLGLTKTDFRVGGFNPSTLPHPQSQLAIAARIAGAVLAVPAMEELFWRGWLLRWLINEDFRRVPIGAFSWGSFGITVTLFGLEHGSLWHVGMITGALYNGVLYKTKSLWACILAHAITNLLLAVYVLLTGKWGYW